jgi:hypothetical protein
MATAGVLPDGYYANGQVQSVYFDTDPAQAVANLVDAANMRIAVATGAASIDPSMVLVSFTFYYGRIRLLGQQ